MSACLDWWTGIYAMLWLWRSLLKARGPRQSPALPIASAGPAQMPNLKLFS